jgi:hypothetical protein
MSMFTLLESEGMDAAAIGAGPNRAAGNAKANETRSAPRTARVVRCQNPARGTKARDVGTVQQG